MAVLLDRRVSTAAKWSRRSAVFSAVLLVTSAAGHRFGVVDTLSLFWLLGIVGGLALLAILLSAIGFLRLWEFGDRGGRNSTKGLVIALVVLAPFAFGAFRVLTLPGLTDVSTAIFNPPTFFHALRQRSPQMNPIGPFVSEQGSVQFAAYPEITGRRYALGMDTTLDIARTVFGQLGWSLHGPERLGAFGGDLTLEVAAPSPWIGFVSDMAIRLTDEDETVYVDARSVSRYGTHDLGDNAAKINRFFASFEEEIELRNALYQVPPAE